MGHINRQITRALEAFVIRLLCCGKASASQCPPHFVLRLVRHLRNPVRAQILQCILNTYIRHTGHWALPHCQGCGSRSQIGSRARRHSLTLLQQTPGEVCSARLSRIMPNTEQLIKIITLVPKSWAQPPLCVRQPHLGVLCMRDSVSSYHTMVSNPDEREFLLPLCESMLTCGDKEASS